MHVLIAEGKHPEARKILEAITTQDPKIRLDVLLAFLVVLDHVTENDKLLEAATEGIEITTKLGNDEVRSYFMARKSIFLLTPALFNGASTKKFDAFRERI